MCVSDLIYREDAYSAIELMDKFALIDNENDSLISTEDALYMIDNIPAVDAKEVKRGHWIPHFIDGDGDVTNVFICSECDKSVRFIMAYHKCEYVLCPWCGAEMNGGNDNE